jgi:subtilase family protein
VFPCRGGRAARWCAAAAATFFVIACGTNQGEAGGLAWHLQAIHADPKRSVGRGGGVVIAFIDTGVTATALPGFASRALSGVNEVTGGRTGGDVNGHGTEMAVIAAGGGDQGVWGVAPAATVLPVVVADVYGHATGAAIAAGITWASTQGAAIINISLAAAVADQEVADAIKAVTDTGILVVASAGDLGLPGPEFPASAQGAIAVYGEDPSGRIGAHSNVPTGAAVVAPGERIETLVPVNSGVRMLAVNGTSAAAALVSGVLAACLSAAASRYPAAQLRSRRCKQLLLTRPTGEFIDLRHIMEAVT